MTKSDEKRAAIIAGQAARELADAAAHQTTGAESGGGGAGKGRRRFVARPPFSGRPRGRPPKT